MKTATFGVLLTLLYVCLEATQVVYLGGLFQSLDPFFFGATVFGFTSIALIGWTWARQPAQFAAAFKDPMLLFKLNFCALVTFTAYLISVRLIEPAITYSVSSGTMPLVAVLLGWLGVAEGGKLRNSWEVFGALILCLGVAFLGFATIAGWTGFVRGGVFQAVLGVVTAMLDGAFFTLILIYSQRLNDNGVGPAAVLGFRLPLYVIVTSGVAATGVMATEPMSALKILGLLALGFALSIPPLYVLQRAVPLVSTLTLATLTALGPIVTFGLQMVEGRVSFATATLFGLGLYLVGALTSAVGAFIAGRGQQISGG